MKKEHWFMILNIFFVLGFVFTLPELVKAVQDSDYLALNILFGLAFIGINFFDLTILKWRKEKKQKEENNGRNRN
jgi:hypothetical protein